MFVLCYVRAVSITHILVQRGVGVAVTQGSVFSWSHIDDASDLDRLRMIMQSMPDEELMQSIEGARGKGRDDYPVRPVWNSILAGIVFGHASIESLRRELLRNGELRHLCGFDPLKGITAVPPAWAYTRFLKQLLRRRASVGAMFDKLVEDLRDLLPVFGRSLAIDSKAIDSYGNPTGKEAPDCRRDTDADWGTKTYKGKRKDGSLWEKTKRWFGYKLHLLVDSTHELPVAFEVTRASASDTNRLLPLIQRTKERHPGLIRDCEELSGDKGYDSTDNNSDLFDEHQIKPIIDIRNMWKDADCAEDGTRLLYPDRADNIVYDYKGTVSCVCPATGEKRQMVYYGFERDRGTIKYRCPAAYAGFDCVGRSRCHKGDGDYGRALRIPLETDRRIFTPLARSGKSWRDKYKKRTAVERVNSRLDVSFGFELHTIRGFAKMELRVGLALVVMLAMAVGSIRDRQAYRMRSLVWSVKEKRLKTAA